MINVYRIINKLNGKMYVGQTEKPIETRFREHLKPSNQSRKIKEAISEYGSSNFDIELLEQCETRDMAWNREQYWIKELNTLSPNGYNLASGGNHPFLCEETRIRIGVSQLGNKHTSGYKLTEERKRQISESSKRMWEEEGRHEYMSSLQQGDKNHFYGKHHSNETKKLLSEYASKRIGTKSSHHKSVMCLETGIIYKTINDAGIAIGVKNPTHIGSCCKGKLKSAYGYTWKFVENIT